MFGGKKVSYSVILFIFFISICGLYPFYAIKDNSKEIHSLIEKTNQSKLIVFKLSELLVTLEMAEKEFISSNIDVELRSYRDLRNEILTMAIDYSKYVRSTLILRDIEEHFSITKKLKEQKNLVGIDDAFKELEQDWLWSLTNLHITIGQQINKDNRVLKIENLKIKKRQAVQRKAMITFGILNALAILFLFLVFRNQYENILKLNMDLEEENEKNKDLNQRVLTQEKFVAIGKLASGVVQEIKNPLNILTTSSDLLKSNFNGLISDYESKIVEGLPVQKKMEYHQNKEESIFLIESLENELKRAEVIISSMGYLSNEREVELKMFDFNNAVDVALSMASNSMGWSDGVKVKLEKKYRSTELIYGDVEYIKTALVSIFLNSYKSIKAKRERDVDFIGMISVCVSSTGTDYVISIRDNGVGLERNVDPKIFFEPFYSSDTKGESVGMGLVTVQKVVTAHSGSVTLSRPHDFSEGCEVILKLPKEPQVARKDRASYLNIDC